MDAVELLLRRTRTFVQAMPPPAGTITRRYLRSRSAGRKSRWTEPYWLFLPQWIAGKFKGPQRAVVGDLLWGQYCLFAYVRMRDDVLDRQAETPRLVFAADAFLVEAERAFAAHIRHDGFWAFFRDALAQTACGILEVDALQRRRHGSLRSLLSAYARVSAIFKVGSAAICLPRDRRAEFARIQRFADNLAIGGQLLDDLQDIHEDLADGRCNSAVRLLVGEVRPAERFVGARVARAIVNGRRVDDLISLVERHTAAARDAVAPLGMRGAERYLERVDSDMEGARQALHRARVQSVFASVPRAVPARRGVSINPAAAPQ